MCVRRRCEKGLIRRMTNDVAKFYDEFSEKLIRDYVFGNLRSDAAIGLACKQLRPETTSVLDVGCGVGVSASRMIQSHPSLRVTAVDISPRNIEIAQKLFPDSRITFRVSDMKSAPADQHFDQVNLIDVYEHVPRADWTNLHQVLSQCLSPTGTLVMTTPSRLHQQWLHDHHPEGLQVVDETVEMADVCRLADDLNATIMHYEMISVWHTNDYVHLVMTRGPEFTEPRVEPAGPRSLLTRVTGRLAGAVDRLRQHVTSAPRERRLEHVRQTLGVDVSIPAAETSPRKPL